MTTRTQWILAQVAGGGMSISLSPVPEPPRAARRLPQGGRRYYLEITDVPDQITGEEVARLAAQTADMRNTWGSPDVDGVHWLDRPPAAIRYDQLGEGAIIRA